MKFDAGMAALHSGLIQRARRPGYVPPPEPPARVVAPVAAPEPLVRVVAPVAAPGPIARRPERRFGLTVRVGWRLKTLLVRIRGRTGRTTQSILHDALMQYLASVEREAPPR